MIWRITATVCLAAVALALLAWPLGHVGLAVTHDGSGRTRTLSLSDGQVWYTSDTLPTAKPLDREHYRLSLGGQPQFQIQSLLMGPSGGRGGPALAGAVLSPTVGVVRLVWVVAGGVGLLLLLAAIPVLRRRRRRRRALCLACGYQRSADDAPCTECGLTPRDAQEATRPRPGRLVRDAGVLVFVVLLGLSCGAWGTVEADRRAAQMHKASAFDYSWYLDTCQPRLTGAVVFAQPGTGPNTLAAVVRRMGPGTTIIMLPGRHELPSPPNRNLQMKLEDMWLVGCGVESTTLALHLEGATRLRIDDAAIDCGNDEALNIRDAGSVMLRGCRVFNYNSGAGGSNAIFAMGTALLIENCEFEGRTGRASESLRGNPLDLRGECFAFLRADRFVDNQEIVRDMDGVLDRCVVTTSGKGRGDGRFWAAQRGGVFERETDYQVTLNSPPPASTKITECLDDVGPLESLSKGQGLKAWTDPAARQQAQTLRIDRDPGFWTRLLLHPSPEVRKIAAGHAKLPTDAEPMPLDQALLHLDQQSLQPDVALSILRAGPAARPALEKAAGEGPARAQANAAALLRLLNMQPPLPDLVRAETTRSGK